jgi:hypothetical protein
VVHVPVLLSRVLHPSCAAGVSEVQECLHAHRRSVRATGARSLPLRSLWTRLVTRFRLTSELRLGSSSLPLDTAGPHMSEPRRRRLMTDD